MLKQCFFIFNVLYYLLKRTGSGQDFIIICLDVKLIYCLVGWLMLAVCFI